MQILFEHQNQTPPRLSILLLDWSCRDSFHILEYLNKQTASREQYEIIWIEYYNRRSWEIERALAEYKRDGRPPVVDKWIILEMPEDVCYHKHLMYNLGIIAGKGEIITICDSDAFAGPTFVESIIGTFGKNNDIVLHMDEVRNTDKQFYPFNYPSIQEITSNGCINWNNGQTIGLLDETDPLHTKNYGACMSALRKDIIAIGGADEHIDYLGHICGPYDMTFRLVNAGKKELWHPKEFLYHTWHPGTDGIDNYLGPHDGYNMSTVALEVRNSLRVLPLAENTAIKILRTNTEAVRYDSLLSQAIPVVEAMRWKPQTIRKRDLKQNIIRCVDVYRNMKNNPRYFFRRFKTNAVLYCFITRLIFKQIHDKLTGRMANKNSVMKKSAFLNIKLFFVFFLRMFKNNIYTVKLCRQFLKKLSTRGIKEAAVYGTDFTTKILCILAEQTPLKVTGIYDKSGAGGKFLQYKVLPYQSLTEFNGKIIIVALTESMEKASELKKIGVKNNSIIRL